MKVRFSVAVVGSMLVACAHPRTPTTTAAGASTAAAPAARPPSHPGVRAVAFAGDVIYAWTDVRLDVWNGTDAKAWAQGVEPVVALAADGSVAVTAAKEGETATRLDVWALGSNTVAFTRTFPNGIERVLGASGAGVALLARFPKEHVAGTETQQILPDRVYGVLWRMEKNTASQLYGLDGCVDGFAMSADAQRFACASTVGGVTWIDTRRNRTVLADLAPDWRPPPTPAADDAAVHAMRTGVFEPLPYDVLSLRLGIDGADVYVTYRGAESHAGWRLEKWTPGASLRSGPVTRGDAATRLASLETGERAKLLAVSRDGRLFVLGGQDPLALRRAPRYQPEPLATDATTSAATAAAFSPDGERLVTGHADGRLRLWEMRTARLLATAGP